MTKQEILTQITAVIENFAGGMEDQLTATACTALTDEIAGTLDTVNPTNTYPPTPR